MQQTTCWADDVQDSQEVQEVIKPIWTIVHKVQQVTLPDTKKIYAKKKYTKN